MSGNISKLAFMIMAIVLGAGVEELLPRFAGVGMPVLLSTVLFFALRRQLAVAISYAIAAGAMEDAISSLPVMASVVFFVAVVCMWRWLRVRSWLAALIYPTYQLWLSIWVREMGSRVFERFVVSLPVGVITAAMTVMVMAWVERKAALEGGDA